MSHHINDIHSSDVIALFSGAVGYVLSKLITLKDILTEINFHIPKWITEDVHSIVMCLICMYITWKGQRLLNKWFPDIKKKDDVK